MNENRAVIDIVIPTYKPGKELRELLRRLERQDTRIRKIIIMNTEEAFWPGELEERFYNLEVHHVKKDEFNHGRTRMEGAAYSDAEYLCFMTQDAMPADTHLLSALLKAIQQNERIGAAYARQLPKKDCRFLEQYTRSFNYPEMSRTKGKEDLEELGIKTYFCSNVCAMYRRDLFVQLGGFVRRAIFNEDMIYAGKMIQSGYKVAYASEARVYHSHNYSGWMQLRRNFDLGVSQAEHPEIFAGIRSEGEGIALVKKTAYYVIKEKKPYLVFPLIWQSGCKYLGYRLGKGYRWLPKAWILRLTLLPAYWEEKV